MKRTLVALITFALVLSTPLLAQFEHPDLKSGARKVRTIVLMPIQVEITKQGMHGGEPMIDESRQVQQSLKPVIANVLEKEGYTVDQAALSPQILEKDPDLRYTVDDLQKRFDQELKQMARKSKDVRKGRYTLGDGVAKLPVGEKVDALLFVRAYGEVLTGGKKAFGWIIAGPVFDTVMMHIGVVDARTGEVLYFAKPAMLKNLAKDPEETAGGVRKAFKNFVKASPAEAAPAAHEAATASPSKSAQDTTAPATNSAPQAESRPAKPARQPASQVGSAPATSSAAAPSSPPPVLNQSQN